MREIKFRAWNEENEKMIEWNSDFFYDTSEVTRWTGDLSAIEMPLMQYTGIKDRNGLDIYENDILLCVDELDGKTKTKGICDLR